MRDLCTLGPHGKRKGFRFDILAGEWIRVETGRKGHGITVSWPDYKRMVSFFRGRGLFLLGNQVDKVKAGSLGEYFLVHLKKSPRYASHYAAVMVYLKDAKVVREHPLTLRIV
jgi:hypothetical protein